NEDRVFVEGDEFAERFRFQLISENSVRGAVTLEDSVRYEPLRSTLRSYLFRCLAERQRFRLSEGIRQEHVMMPANRIERSVECDEVARDESCSLMNQLIEGVLAICTWLAPVDGTCVDAHRLSIEGHALAIAFHDQ